MSQEGRIGTLKGGGAGEKATAPFQLSQQLLSFIEQAPNGYRAV